MSRQRGSTAVSGRGSVVDPIAGTWRAQRWILLAYLLVAMATMVTWGRGFAALAFAAVGVAWAGQWLITAAVLAFMRTRIGRFFRNNIVMASILIVVIVVLAVVTWMVFGSDARVNGWVVLWRVVTTLWISSFTARFAVLGGVLQDERATQESLRQVRDENLDALRAQRAAVIDRVADLMNRSLERSAVNTQHASTEISEFARTFIRPLSHEMMDSKLPTEHFQRAQDQRTPWREILSEVASRPALRPWLMATVVFWAYLLTTVETVDQTPIDASEASGPNVLVDGEPFITTVLLLFGIFAVTAVSALVLQRVLLRVLPRLGLRSRLSLLVAAPVVIALVVELTVQVTYITPGLAGEISRNLLDRLVPAISIVAIALLIVINRTLAQAFVSAEERAKALTHELSWELSRLQCTHTREQQYFASQLHGPLQSLLTSAAMRIANMEPGTADWDAALAGVRTDFESTIERLATGTEDPLDIRKALDDLQRTWDGVCDVEFTIDDDVLQSLDADWVSAGIVNDIFIEACANAAIHGGAQHVRIDAQWLDTDELVITAINDGSPDEGGAEGLGTAMLNRVAITWSREPTPEGVCLQVVLAVPRIDAQTARRSHLYAG